jgi:pre-mRNA-splicing helicase BRR2
MLDDDDVAPVTAAVSSGQAPLRTDKLLDLDALAFSDGSHLMTNKRCELPPDAWRAQKKGYEEIHVPAVKVRPWGPPSLQLPVFVMAVPSPSFVSIPRATRT